MWRKRKSYWYSCSDVKWNHRWKEKKTSMKVAGKSKKVIMLFLHILKRNSWKCCCLLRDLRNQKTEPKEPHVAKLLFWYHCCQGNHYLLLALVWCCYNNCIKALPYETNWESNYMLLDLINPNWYYFAIMIYLSIVLICSFSTFIVLRMICSS